MCENILNSPLTFQDKFHLSGASKSIMAGMLERNLKKRLGSGTLGINGVKEHPFYAKIDWKLLLLRQIKPPFKPTVKSDTDVTNFDKVSVVPVVLGVAVVHVCLSRIDIRLLCFFF